MFFSHERNSGQGLILSSSIQRDISLYVQSNKNAFLEKEVKHDDTLQSIALEYNVTVSNNGSFVDLKVNQEFK